ncbi:MAG: acyltransferase, partial [Myxococcales bacterium]
MAGLWKGRLESLDALRGGAALAVVVSHAITYLEQPPTGSIWFAPLFHVLSEGHLGVSLFFVLSGFCIHLRWARQFAATGDTSLPFGPFWRRRLHRLYPPYFILLCATMAMVVFVELRGIVVPVTRMYPEPRLSWMGLDFLAHATMLHGLSPIFDSAGGNPPYWTLAREEYFYVLYVFLLAARRRWGLLPSVGGVLVLGLVFPLVMRLLLPPSSAWWSVVQTSALVLWFQWCLGMISVEAVVGLIELPRWCSSWVMVPVWGALALASAPQTGTI